MKNYNDIDRAGAFACFSIVAGALSLLFFLFPTVYSPRAASELLPFFERHRSIYFFVAITILIWMTASIPFVAAVEGLLRGEGRSMALAAVLLSAGGVLLIGFAVFAFVGAFLAIVAAGGAAPNAAAAAYQAKIWSNLSFFLADPGLMVLGLGQFLFARLAWKSAIFPKAVSLIGIVGGLAGLLTLATYQTSLLAIIQFAAFGVWGIATGLVLLRSRAQTHA